MTGRRARCGAPKTPMKLVFFTTMQLVFFTTAICLLLACGHARAQEEEGGVRQPQQQPSQTSGVFTSYIGGQAVLTESYTFAAAADGTLRADAEVVPAAGGPAQKTLTLATRSRAVSFTVESGGARSYAAEFGEGVVRVVAAGQPPRESPTKATVVLENLLWHQFHFLLAQYDGARGGPQTFHFFLPAAGRDFEMVVERAGSRTYGEGPRALKAVYYTLLAAGNTIEMWTDEAGTPQLFALRAQRLRAVRRGAEELERRAFAAAPEAPAWKPPAYAVPGAFREQDVTVGAGTEWALPGTLTMPAGRGPHPSLVLVHGSGPNDRDETVGVSKPFRDLAWGLASRGVAVLRYEKRSRVHGARLAALKSMTVKEETVDDALAAVALLRRTPGVDAKRIFVLGHSLGGGLVPRIGAADPRIRGFVILAGYTRPLADEIVRQYEYLFALDGTLGDDERKLIEAARRDAARVRSLTPADAAAGRMLRGAPAAYWLDLRDYSPPAAARKLRRPLLVLQGERDYNVTMDAFADWRRALARRRDADFKSYPKLDHGFLEGAGPSKDTDYAAPRNVPLYVVADIADWIKRR